MHNEQPVDNVIDLALYRARRRWAEQDQALEAYMHQPWGHRPGSLPDGGRWVRLPTLDQIESGWGPYE